MLHIDMLASASPESVSAIRKGAQTLRAKGITRDDHPDFSVSYTGTMYDELYAVCMLFVSNGEQVYQLQPTLERMLGCTDVSRVSRDVLRFPFDCFYLDLTDSGCSVWDGERKSVPARGVYVTPDLGGRGILKLVFWGHENGNPQDDAIQWLTLDLDSAAKSPCGRIDLDETFRRVYLTPENDTSVTGMATQPMEYSTILGCDAPGGYDSMNFLLRLTINALLYINSKQSDASRAIKKTRRGPRRLRRVMALHSAPTVRTLGRRYEHGKYNGFTVGDRRRRVVPGHWKEVWIGTKTDEHGNRRNGTHREPRWILPYIVNAYSDTEITRSTVRVL